MPFLKKYLKYPFIFILLLLPIVSSNAFSMDSSFSVGGGFQYGAIIGVQGAIHNETHNLRAAIGIVGASIGYDYKFATNYSIGVTATETFPIHNIRAISINYYSLGKFDKGWRFGIDLGKADGFYCMQNCTDNDEDQTMIFFNAGYAF